MKIACALIVVLRFVAEWPLSNERRSPVSPLHLAAQGVLLASDIKNFYATVRRSRRKSPAIKVQLCIVDHVRMLRVDGRSDVSSHLLRRRQSTEIVDVRTRRAGNLGISGDPITAVDTKKLQPGHKRNLQSKIM